MNVNELRENQCFDIKFKYEFESCVGEIEGDRYIQKVKATIVKTDDNGNEQIIGKGDIKILLLEQAMNDNYSIYDVFDTYEYTMRIGSMIYDFENFELKEDLQNELFGFEMMSNSNICIFERMVILPEYRGLGIGAKFVKDKYKFFSSACGLIVIQPFPLQLESIGPSGRTDAFESKMEYESMEQNAEKAAKSLKKYYKRLGYLSARGYKELMFLVPGMKNEKLEAINMDDMIVKY